MRRRLGWRCGRWKTAGGNGPSPRNFFALQLCLASLSGVSVWCPAGILSARELLHMARLSVRVVRGPGLVEWLYCSALSWARFEQRQCYPITKRLAGAFLGIWVYALFPTWPGFYSAFGGAWSGFWGWPLVMDFVGWRWSPFGYARVALARWWLGDEAYEQQYRADEVRTPLALPNSWPANHRDPSVCARRSGA